MPDRSDFVVIANRLPVDRRDEPDGSVTWSPSPGGLVAAMEPVMRRHRGAWVGWTGAEGEAPPPFDADDMHLVAVPLSAREIAEYYEGMSNATLWPLYHDVIAAPRYDRHWWDSYLDVNRRFADVAATTAERGATVWVQDYQLQMVPRLLRDVRPDLKIGFFNHIPFPPYELFSQLPWRRQVLDGLLGADLVGFQRPADANNFLRACRRVGLVTRRGTVRAPGLGGERQVRAQAFPISVDAESIGEIARRPEVVERSRQIRSELGDPDVVLLGVDRLDYTKGILHRLQTVEELYAEGRLKIPGTVFVQVATPSRERVGSYRALRAEVEVTVGRINGERSRLGHPAVHYLHKSFPKEELVALYLAADVLLVTALRDGMNLVAKEYIASRHDEHGALVLSEFAGAAIELPQAHVVNPHDIEGLKAAVVRAVTAPPKESQRRMRAMRKRVQTHDVARWAGDFLRVLERSAGANEHLLEDLAGDDDIAVPDVPPDLSGTGSVTTRDTSRSAQAATMDADVDRTDLADVGAGTGGEQVDR
jgi:alpha,alpha-trehalose-phosphate synthase [UDP-forming]